jgi:hypothetical protein
LSCICSLFPFLLSTNDWTWNTRFFFSFS